MLVDWIWYSLVVCRSSYTWVSIENSTRRISFGFSKCLFKNWSKLEKLSDILWAKICLLKEIWCNTLNLLSFYENSVSRENNPWKQKPNLIDQYLWDQSCIGLNYSAFFSLKSFNQFVIKIIPVSLRQIWIILS